jgi:uncharacterized protein (TIGR02145 family)
VFPQWLGEGKNNGENNNVRALPATPKQGEKKMEKVTILLMLLCTAVFAQQKGSFTDPRDEAAAKAAAAGEAAAALASEKAMAEARAVAAEEEAVEAKAVKINSGTFADSRDGKRYRTVKIGEQTWMAENLNYNANSSKCYDNKEANCQKYGRLYDLNTAKHKEVCPSGWHLPTKLEWNQLTDYVGENAGTKLKAKSGWNNFQRKSGNGTDDYGFSALPGGYFNSDGNFYNVGDGGDWWSFSGNDFSLNTGAYLVHNIFNFTRFETAFYSVRCIKEDAEWIATEAAIKANSGTFTDFRDGKAYKTINIGKQTWMAENLNYNANSSKCYNNNTSNCDKYGRIYNWNTATKACPSGWHLPSDAEWTQLTDFVGGSETAGTKLKAKSGWFQDDSGSGTDKYGFSALPGGYCNSDGNFDKIDDIGYWWSSSSTEDNASTAYLRDICCLSTDVYRGSISKAFFISVRCLLD